MSLSVGALGFIGAGAGVTELLDPHVWPSVLLGLPVGFVVGVVLVAFRYLGLTYWDERLRTGTASQDTVRRFRTTTAALLGFVTGGGLAVVLSTQAMGLASAVLVGIRSGAPAAYVTFRRDRERRSPPTSPA
ncbi:hypothetical protein [Halobellus ruber]|uniref:hypothetical protein n=1 Tax=Halobellus ruber TaxID=2761102 RepID=UPI001C8A1A53|nr:hypothetical protein [Halobellus ruber]